MPIFSTAYNVIVDGHEAVVRERWFDGLRMWQSTTRVYGALPVVATAELAEHEKTVPPAVASVPTYPTDENGKPRDHTAEELEIKRQYKIAKRKMVMAGNKKLPVVVEKIASSLRAAGHDVVLMPRGADQLVSKFSPTAGCSCPCSPGFVLNARMIVNGSPVDISFRTPVDEEAAAASETEVVETR
jgi:hypothetical protein